MYSRNYGGFDLENRGAVSISESLRRESLRKEKETVPVKSFPEAGALAHFQSEYGNRHENDLNKNQRISAEEMTERKEETASADAPASLPVVAESVSESVDVTVKHTGTGEGLASRLKKNLSKYTESIFGSFSFDDFLLIALLLLFLTDDSEENDPLIPIILMALLLF